MWILELLSNLLLTLRPWPRCQLPRAPGWALGGNPPKNPRPLDHVSPMTWSVSVGQEIQTPEIQTNAWVYHSKLVVQRSWFDWEIAEDNRSQWFNSGNELAWVVLCSHEFLLEVVPETFATAQAWDYWGWELTVWELMEMGVTLEDLDLP